MMVSTLFKRLRMCWPVRIDYTGKGAHGNAVDGHGRRYADYRWLAIQCGHVRFNLWPPHIRGIKTSIYFREGEPPAPPPTAEETEAYLNKIIADRHLHA